MFPGRPDPTAAPAEAPPTVAPPEWPPTLARRGRSGRPDADEALRLLRAGNLRYAVGTPVSPRGGRARIERVDPYGLVLSCVDGRGPVEALFDQSEGALCVARSAAHVVDRAGLASVEFVVGELAVPLVVVLGHEDCLAIRQVVAGRAGGYLRQEIGPALVEGTVWPTTRRHVERTVAALRPAVPGVRVVGATYHLDSGRVEWL